MLRLAPQTPVRALDVGTGGFRTRLLDAGAADAEALLLLHGGGLGVDAGTNWLGNIERFAAEFRCLAPDLVGFGATEHPVAPPVGAEAWVGLRARQCLDLLDELGLERAHLVGNSAGGGAVALALLREAPERVAGVVLLGGAGVGTGDGDRSVAPARALAFYDDPTPHAMERLLRRFSAAPDDLPLQQIAQQRFETALRPEVRRSFEAMWAAGGEGIAIDEAELQAVDRPVLCLHGREDALADPERSRRLASLLPRADLCVLANAGHWLHLDRIDSFQAWVSAFLHPVDA
jgi:2-hydroxymuconate-semialdehyde hydrolase